MRNVLTHCAELAHLKPEDVCKLEQDIRDIINMAAKLSEFEEDGENEECGNPLDALRTDTAENPPRDAELFRNAKHINGGNLCVPRITGV